MKTKRNDNVILSHTVHTYALCMYINTYVHKAFEHSKSYIVLCAKITAVNGETLQNHVCDHSKFCITLYTIILLSQIDLSARQHANRATIPLVHGYSHNMRTLYGIFDKNGNVLRPYVQVSTPVAKK